MSTFKSDCPHCGTVRVAFTIICEHIERKNPIWWDTLAECQFCGARVLAIFRLAGGVQPSHMLESEEWRFVAPHNIYPKKVEHQIPSETPERSARYFKQGIDNLPQNPDAAGVMFRKALEAGLAKKFPEIEGDLYKKIKNAAENGLITRDLAEWAHQVRLGGNDAAHDDFTIEDAERLRGFAELVFLYLFTLPAMLESAQGTSESRS